MGLYLAGRSLIQKGSFVMRQWSYFAGCVLIVAAGCPSAPQPDVALREEVPEPQAATPTDDKPASTPQGDAETFVFEECRHERRDAFVVERNDRRQRQAFAVVLPHR